MRRVYKIVLAIGIVILGIVVFGFFKVKAGVTVTRVSYSAHVQNIGWQDYKTDGVMAGTSGKGLKLEAIKIKLENQEYPGEILYSAHIQNIGWQSYHLNDDISGTSGKGYRLEAIKIRLWGEISEHYDVYYRVHAQNFGWMNWAKNDEEAGTSGYGYRLEAIEVVLVYKGNNPPTATGNYLKAFAKKSISYSTHVQNIGWQDYKADGVMAGTSGKGLKLEAVKIKLENPEYPGDIVYSTHIQNIGWQEYRENNDVSGTSGKGYRLEAIKIKLNGLIECMYV